MLPAMPSERRVTPLAGWSVVATFVLIGVALLATVWTTRSTVVDATAAVGRGQAVAMEHSVRAALADLDGMPTREDLATILAEHDAQGLRYIATIEGGRIVVEAGRAVGSGEGTAITPNRRLQEVDGRIRLQARPPRRLRDRNAQWRVVLELVPVQAAALRDASTLTLGVGALAAASLLGVAIVLVRREARRHAEERKRLHERRLASLGEMSAVLAHEIKNPLASLKGNAQLLATMLPAGEKSRAKAERVVDEAMRLEKLTNDLLKFVRTGTIERATADPATIVREAVSTVAGEVTIDTSAAPKTWSLDAGRIRELVINLVDNAVAAGPPVAVTVREQERKLVIEVADRGEGVPESEREKIFEPFHTGKTQGTGLGLAVVRRVIEQHGGTIAVLSNPGGGALFRAEIPGRE